MRLAAAVCLCTRLCSFATAQQALKEAKELGMIGKLETPFVLKVVWLSLARTLSHTTIPHSHLCASHRF
jgi:hypothetical protein